MRQKTIRILPLPATSLTPPPPGPACALRAIPLLLFLGLISLNSPARALGLGAASTSSRIGGPLRIEIPLQSADVEGIELSCLKLASSPPGYTEELPWLSRARLSLELHENLRLLVITATSNNHPALMLGVQVSCGMEFRRDYTLLLNPPAREDNQLASSDSPPSPAQATRETQARSPARLLVKAGDTARSLADQLYPNDISAQRRMARALLSQNENLLGKVTGTYTALPAGLELDIPLLPASLATRTDTPSAREPARQDFPTEPKAFTTARPGNKPKGRDRLFVSAAGDTASLQMSTAIGQRKELNEDQRSRLRTEMQLIATLDEKIASQLELADRLRQLEALQTKLKDDADRLEAELLAQQAQQQSAPFSIKTSSPIPLYTTSNPAGHEKVAVETTNQAPKYTALLLGLLGALAAALGAGLWFWQRNNKGEALEGETLPFPTPGEGLEPAEQLIEPLSEADIWPDQEGHAPNPRIAASMEGALGHLSASGLGPSSMLKILDDNVEEHDSAVELAEIMMSFGRVQGAAQTLADFIRANPKQAVKPWIKLLEVYRAADMRTEYEALTAQLNKTFNVRTTNWDEFEIARLAPESLENMPHIMARLHEHWGSRECQNLLHQLLRDNRQGTRQGFSLAIIDEILLLLGILESQIGPFCPEPGEQTQALFSQEQALASPTAALNIPPIDTESLAPATLQFSKPEEPAKEELLAFSNSVNQLDFELDMTDLTKTLHLNLDELDGTPTQL